MLRFDGIGNRLKAFRLGSGLAAEEIAQKLGISRTALYRFEKGEVAKIETLEKLAELLAVSVPTLLGVGVEYIASAVSSGTHAAARGNRRAYHRAGGPDLLRARLRRLRRRARRGVAQVGAGRDRQARPRAGADRRINECAAPAQRAPTAGAVPLSSI